MRQQIALFLDAGVWKARFSGDDQEIRRLFGTDTLPTPFTSQTPAADVLERLKRLNPNDDVFLES